MAFGVSLRRFGFTIGRTDSVHVTDTKPNGIEITRLHIPLPHLPRAFDGLTIAQISDLHMGEWMTLARMQTVVRQVNALHPDVIAVTGDFVGAIGPDTPHELTRALQGLNAREGVFGVLGNHDHHTHAPTVRRAIHNSGTMRLLTNENTAIERDGKRLYIVGVDDIEANRHDLAAALDGIPDGAATILLAHEPDFADEVVRTQRVGLQLSGHTHGGQIRLPGKGAVILPELGKKYQMGLYNVDDLALYVNRGVGMVSVYIRINCRPEITHITLAAV